MDAVRHVTVLGATGSIGKSTLELVAAEPARLRVRALTANGNWQKLAEQALAFRPEMVAVAEDATYAPLKEALAGTGIRVAAGGAAVEEAASLPAEWTMAAIVGAAGLAPTLAAVRRGKAVALANKECLVCAGELFMQEVRKSGATLLPADSEHNAIFQVFDFLRPERVEKIILTASGGPFRSWTKAQMEHATPEQALRHPNWSMGAKITIDSATMVNKGLELIEAYHLFPVEERQIEVLVHPESIVHGLVQYVDGSLLAQLGQPDMRTPIAHTLAWPDRMESGVKKLDLAALGKLTFEAPDAERFPALTLAREALRAGGAAPAVFNAANEVAVRRFLEGKLGFMDILRVIGQTLAKMEPQPIATLSDAVQADRRARVEAENICAAQALAAA